MKRYQFVSWFPLWQGFHFLRSFYGLTLIYDWYLFLGFWEIRKWHDLKDGDIERYNAKTQQLQTRQGNIQGHQIPTPAPTK